eukprot:60953_1
MSTESPQLQPLEVLTSYTKAFGELPKDADTLVAYSSTMTDGEHKLDYSSAQRILHHYQNNLKAYRAGKVDYCHRTRTVSYSNPNTPNTEDINTKHQYPNTSIQIANPRPTSASSITTNVHNQTPIVNESETNAIWSDLSNTNTNTSIDSVKSADSDSEPDTSSASVRDECFQCICSNCDASEKCTKNHESDVINTESPRKKYTKLSRNTKIPKKYRKNNVYKEEKQSCVWETIWSLFVTPCTK